MTIGFLWNMKWNDVSTGWISEPSAFSFEHSAKYIYPSLCWRCLQQTDSIHTHCLRRMIGENSNDGKKTSSPRISLGLDV